MSHLSVSHNRSHGRRPHETDLRIAGQEFLMVGVGKVQDRLGNSRMLREAVPHQAQQTELMLDEVIKALPPKSGIPGFLKK